MEKYNIIIGDDQNKKRDFSTSHHLQNHHFPSGVVEAKSVILAELFSPESLSFIEAFFIRPVVREEVEKKIESHFKFHESSSSGELEVGGCGAVKLKLCLMNNIPSVIFTGNDIEADNGEQLGVALCEFNNIVPPNHPLSSALIEFVVVNGEFCCNQHDDEITRWTLTDFNENVLTRREGERPLIVGDDRRVRLKNGVALVKNLSFPCNSSRCPSKKYRLGVRIIDKEILAKFPRIGEAVSNPFRVKDHRGEVNKKRHPPMEDDEVWRLEGIGKDGKYHKRLSSKGITTVYGFLKAFKMDDRSLRKLLGRVPNKMWKAMVNNAFECVPVEVSKQKIDPSNNNGHGFSEINSGEFQDYDFMLEDYPELLSR